MLQKKEFQKFKGWPSGRQDQAKKIQMPDMWALALNQKGDIMNVTHTSQVGTTEIKRYSDPESAPNYNTIGGFKGAKLTNVAIVENGTKNGNATVDLVFEDESGQKHIVMVMGSLIQTINTLVGVIR